MIWLNISVMLDINVYNCDYVVLGEDCVWNNCDCVVLAEDCARNVWDCEVFEVLGEL